MNKIFLEYGKNYNIPVNLQIDGVTNRLVEGTINIDNKYVPKLTVNICNIDDINNFNDKIKIDLIKCYPKNARPHILLIACEIYPVDSFSGIKRSFTIYFDYILVGCEKIKTIKDLKFSTISFSIENLYKWILPHGVGHKQEDVLLKAKIENINNCNGIFKFISTYNKVQDDSQDNRLYNVKHDVIVEIRLIGGKFSLEEIRYLIRDLEAFFTCLIGKSCFCTDTVLKNKVGGSGYFHIYNFLDAMHQSDPEFKLTHTLYSLLPYISSFKEEFKKGINKYFLNREKLNNIMYKISSVILYHNRFLFDIKFHYICTLIETCFYNFIYKSEIHDKDIDYEKIKEKLYGIFEKEEQFKNFMKSISHFHEPSFRKKIKELIKLQYKECHIVKFENDEIEFIINNRNNISHGDNLELSEKYEHQTVMEKLMILIFYSIWKTFGLTASTIKQNIIKSSSTFLYSISKEDIIFEESEKISISNEEFEKLESLKFIYCLVLEKYDNRYRINANYTRYVNKDIHYINYYTYTYNYLKCYYDLDYVNKFEVKNYIYLLNNSDPEKKQEISTSIIVSLNSNSNKKLYKLNDSLIPTKAYEYSKENNLSILKSYREFKKLTINDLAKKVGVSVSTISSYEKRSEIKNKEIYRKILKVLGTDLFVEDLLFWK